MSAKNLDRQGRWRSKTVAFRVSPEEAELIDKMVAASGLNKQDYLCSRATQHEIKVFSNPRVFKALKTELADVLNELRRIEAGKTASPDLIDLIEHLNMTIYGFKEGN